MKNMMFYDHPAARWEEALPVGNGRIGAMVPGGKAKETIFLNEDTLWSGYPMDYNDSNAFPYLEKARNAVFEKRYRDAENILNLHMTGIWNESYLPMAELCVEIEDAGSKTLSEEPGDYVRSLDLSTGVCTTEFSVNKNCCRRTVFCSFPDQILAVRLEADRPVNWIIDLASKLKGWKENTADTLFFHGWCPEAVEPSYYECENPVRYMPFENTKAIRFKVGVKALAFDGEVNLTDGQIRAKQCRDCLLLVSSANSFVAYDRPADGEYEHRLAKCLEQAGKKSYSELYENHVKDHGALFGRVELDLGHTDRENLPMTDRLRLLTKPEDDPELIATAFQFGRYLTIASSREGTEPANLQGIWNQELRAPWSSNYTININTEMNYWLTEVCNLPECAQPLIRFITECAKSGSKTARVNYHCRGWCVHHNVDLWRKTTAVGPRTKELNVQPWSFWLAGGGWLCRHLWEHYQYTKDQEFLRTTAFPISMECASFYLDFLVHKDGKLVTCPSTSPENMFIENGVTTGISYGSSMDMEVIEELFRHCLGMAKELEASAESRERGCGVCIRNEADANWQEAGQMPLTKQDRNILREIESALPRLLGRKRGKYGQLQEWAEDYKEHEVTHRHLSHLYGLYPSELFTDVYGADTGLKEACRISLKRRGENGVPWSRAWKIGLQARLLEGEEAGKEVLRYLQLADAEEAGKISYTDGGIYENLFAGTPLQIDGCLGFSAGIAEMLVQDHTGEVRLLPAIPKAWKKGYVKGLRLRGGKCIEIKWDENGVKSSVWQSG